MKLEIIQKNRVEVEATAIRVVAAVRYEEEDMPNDYPHRKKDTWDVTIDLETGHIQDWPQGTPANDLHMKVTDCGSYYLLGGRGETIGKIESDVPRCFPGDHYGEYLNFNIDENGKITNWLDKMDERRVMGSFGLTHEE